MPRPTHWQSLRCRLRRLRTRRRNSAEPLELVDAALHVEVEAICPDCLTWIQPGDYVRRNGYGLLEHEVCPPEHVRNASRR